MTKLLGFLKIIYLILRVEKSHHTTRFDGKTGKLVNSRIPSPSYCTTEQHYGIKFWNGHKFCPHCGAKINHILKGKQINLGGLIKKIQESNSSA